MSNIQVGDLVVVVRTTSCCGNGSFLGQPFIVEMTDDNSEGFCAYCLHCFTRTASAHGVHGDFTMDRLKRIPPLSELESIEHKESEPA